MWTYIAKRLLLLVPTLIIITVISYAMMRLAPGEPGKSNMLAGGDSVGMMDEKASRAREQFEKQFHLDKPWYVGYYYWIKGIVTEGDFGESITISIGKPVWKLIHERLLVTMKINVWSIALIYLIAIPAGLYSAVFRNSLLDRMMTVFFFMLYSMPSFWVGLLLIVFVSHFLPDWPTAGIAATTPADASLWAIYADTARHYVLPVICLSYGALASMSRYARVGMLEVIRQDYIRTARAKGLSEWTVILKHALRNSLIPLVTIFAGILPWLVGGSIIVEYLFTIPGMGSLSLEALNSRDYPVLITLFGFSALLTLLGILLSDILYCLVDPRISLD